MILTTSGKSNGHGDNRGRVGCGKGFCDGDGGGRGGINGNGFGFGHEQRGSSWPSCALVADTDEESCMMVAAVEVVG